LSSLSPLLSSPHPLLLIGATGCGKSTQLPQHLLAALPGCRVLVAQPRRLAAVSLASRVAKELGSPPGRAVGHSVRGDSNATAATRCTFATYGVLRAMLSGGGPLPYSHIVLDEVHERGADLDLLLLHYKRQASRRCERKANGPKLILMSATVTEATFKDYFPDLETISIPGRAFPVERFYLEQAIKDAGHVCAPSSAYARASPLPDAPAASPLAGRIAEAQAALKAASSPAAAETLAKRLSSLLAAASSSAAADDPTTAYLSPLSLARTREELALSAPLARSLRAMDPAKIQEPLVAELVRKHHEQPGDVLVFLPGLKEISSLSLYLSSNLPGGFQVQPLHGSLSSGEQMRVFEEAPVGVTKVRRPPRASEASATFARCRLAAAAAASSAAEAGKREGWRGQRRSVLLRGLLGGDPPPVKHFARTPQSSAHVAAPPPH
jgi:HrpA-like RNA helicase